MNIPQSIELVDVPNYIETWIVAKVPRFVPAILGRWQRNRVDLPETFLLLLCPLAEINSHGGLPKGVKALTDPRLTCRHFTGCNRPYFAAMFYGENSESYCQQALDQLPWSESYRVRIDSESIRLEFFGATEDIDEEDLPADQHTQRTVQELLDSGELLEILA